MVVVSIYKRSPIDCNEIRINAVGWVGMNENVVRIQ